MPLGEKKILGSWSLIEVWRLGGVTKLRPQGMSHPRAGGGQGVGWQTSQQSHQLDEPCGVHPVSVTGGPRGWPRQGVRGARRSSL